MIWDLGFGIYLKFGIWDLGFNRFQSENDCTDRSTRLSQYGSGTYHYLNPPRRYNRQDNTPMASNGWRLRRGPTSTVTPE
jgi:hypothetical protein